MELFWVHFFSYWNISSKNIFKDGLWEVSLCSLTCFTMGFPCAPAVKNPPANGSRRSLGVGSGNPLQFPCLENFHGERSLVSYSPGSNNHLFVFMNLFSFLFVPLFCFWDFTYKWDQQYLSLSVRFISFSIIHSRYIHVVTNGKIACFLWLSNIPLSVCVCVSHLLYPCIPWAFCSVPLLYMSVCVCASTIVFCWLCSTVVVTS